MRKQYLVFNLIFFCILVTLPSGASALSNLKLAKVLQFGVTLSELHFSKNGRLLGTCDPSTATLIWDTRSWKVKYTLPPATSMTFSPDGKSAVISCTDRTIRMYDLRKLKLKRSINLNLGTPILLSYSPDGNWLACVSDNYRVVRVWDSVNWTEVSHYKSNANVRCFSFVPGSTEIWIPVRAEVIRYNFIKKQVDHKIAVKPLLIDSMALYKNNLVISSAHGFISVIDVNNGRIVANPQGILGGVKLLVLSPNQKMIVSVSSEHVGTTRTPFGNLVGEMGGTLMFWDTHTWFRIRSFQAERTSVVSLAFSPNGFLLVTGSGDGRISVWMIVT